MIKTTLINYTKYSQLMKFVTQFYFKDLQVVGLGALNRKVLFKCKTLELTRGPVEAATYIKLCRLAITKTLSGEVLPRPFGISLAKDQLPSLLPYEIRKRVIEGDKLLISYLLTLLQVSKLIKGDPKKIKTDTITDEGTYNDTIPQSEIAICLNKMGFARGHFKPSFDGFSWISTAGPNGLSILRAMEDLTNLPQPLLDSMITLNGGKESYFAKSVISLSHFLDHCKDTYIKIFNIKPAKTKYLRRISIKADKEGKSRPFAIFDYISQMALTSLHDYVFNALKSLPQDATFNQNGGFRDLLYGGYKFFASFDLKAATDRFPLSFQKRVVDHLCGSFDMSEAWAHIMVGYAFVFPNGKSVRFSVGQPLGAKSSWGVFSLSHHVVVHISALRIGMKLENLPYKLLGDDIVIMDRLLANSYLEVMTELGVEISKTKTHIGENLFEFAKRFYYRGSEITQFPITAMVENLSIYPLLSQALESASERGFLPLFIQSNSPDFWKRVAELSVPSNQRRMITYIEKKFKQFSLLPTSSKPYMVRLQDLISLSEAYNVRDVPSIDKALLNAIIEIREREIDRLVNKKTKYNMVIQSLLSQLMFSIPWDRITVTHREFLPVISSLDKSTALKTDTLINVRELQSGLQASETLETDPIRPVPSLIGLQPIRPNEVIARSRSALLKPLINQLKLIGKET
ncbi:RNA-dependent RNA polymerase [Erysiphe necator associated mitovirus 29]|nr:RNA-dependent RNA polymerase [Erysiphe necator associated mitovirus 29]